VTTQSLSFKKVPKIVYIFCLINLLKPTLYFITSLAINAR
jgi:hypothetical protein